MMWSSKNKVCHHLIILSRKCQQLTRILPIRAFIDEVKSLHRYTKIGCLDFGTKCIGVAMTDETKQYSFPVGAIFVKQPPQAIDSITDLHRQLQLFNRKENIRSESFLHAPISLTSFAVSGKLRGVSSSHHFTLYAVTSSWDFQCCPERCERYLLSGNTSYLASKVSI
jgi:hypothetical protein